MQKLLSVSHPAAGRKDYICELEFKTKVKDLKSRFSTTLLLLLIFNSASAQNSSLLRTSITKILSGKACTIGVAVTGFNGKDTLTFNGHQHFPMQSVFKFPIALTTLHQVDLGELNLADTIRITQQELTQNTYSPIRTKYPNGVTLKLSELIRYSVAESDNIATDILLNIVGGVASVAHFMKQSGINEIAVKYNEAQQHGNWENQYENWISPDAANLILKTFYENRQHQLSTISHQFIWKVMEATTTGGKSIRQGLPKGTKLAHKTGHSGTDRFGITAAVNDIGIVFLPNGKYFYLSVFISNSKEDDSTNQHIIALIAKTCWNYFLKRYSHIPAKK